MQENEFEKETNPEEQQKENISNEILEEIAQSGTFKELSEDDVLQETTSNEDTLKEPISQDFTNTQQEENISTEIENEKNSQSFSGVDFCDNDEKDNILSALDFEESVQNDAGNIESENQSANQTAEIVYTTDDKNSGNYSCNYVENSNNHVKKEKKKNMGSNGMKVAALVIAAAFTLTFMTYVGFSIAKHFFGDFIDINFDSAHPSANTGIFQMEQPRDTNDNKSESKVNEIILNKDESGKIPLSINQIAEKCKKSSVGIMIEKETYYFGMSYKTSGVGSGFILSEDGYIATNNHVIEGATKITVMLDDETTHEAVLVGADPITDIAVVKIEAENLPVLERGNSDNVYVGDLAVAIGTPASIELAGTVTDGIISAVNRQIDITDDYGNIIKTMTLIQTNATINPGNSGGPLINRYGQVIGINTLKLTAQYEGIGFAIPINGAIDIMNQLIADGKVSDRGTSLVTGAPSIGIQCSDITDQEAKYYGIPKGVLVIQINKASSAANAGLRRGDIILEFQGKKVETTNEINEIKDQYKPDDEVTMKIYRDGDGEMEITFKLDIKQ